MNEQIQHALTEDNEMLLQAAKILKVSPEKLLKNVKPVPGKNAYYFYDSSRGGLSVIIDEKGDKLVGTSSVSFDEMVEKFSSGKRN